MRTINYFNKILLGIAMVFNFNSCQKGPKCPDPPTIISKYIAQYKKEMIPFSSNYKQRYRDMKTGEISLFTVQSLQDTILSMIINVQDDDCPKDFRYEMNKVTLIDSIGANLIGISHYPENGSYFGTVNFHLNSRSFNYQDDYFYMVNAKTNIIINGIIYDSVATKFIDSNYYLMFKPNYGIIRIVTPEKSLEIYE